VRYEYDANNRLESVTDWNGNVTTYEYDAMGRVVRSLQLDGSVVTRTFDDTRDLSKLSVQDRSGDSIYDAQYTRDLAGRLIEETVRRPLRPGHKEGSQAFAHDAAHQLLTGINGTSYSYDLDGNLITGDLSESDPGVGVASSESERTLYQYDDLDRVIRAEYSEGATTGATYTWSYDSAGNVTSAEVTPLQASAAIGGAQQSADDSSTKLPSTLAYDEYNRLTSVEHDPSISRSGSHSARYHYDAEGLRVRADFAAKWVIYVHDVVTGQLLEGRDENGRVIARYVHGLGLISREGSDGSVSVYHYDQRGSTVALSEATTGEITDRYAYGPYGRLLAQQGDMDQPFKYNGRDGVMDDGVGLYFMRTRYYAPGLMRWVHRDLLSDGSIMNTQSQNPYMYVLGNPIDKVDPAGAAGPLASAALGAAVNVLITIAIDLADNQYYDENGNKKEGFGFSTPGEVYAGAAVEGAITGLIPAATAGRSVKAGIGIGALIGGIGGAAGGAIGGIGRARASGLEGREAEEAIAQDALWSGVAGAIGGAVSGGFAAETFFLKGTSNKSGTIAKAWDEFKEGVEWVGVGKYVAANAFSIISRGLIRGGARHGLYNPPGKGAFLPGWGSFFN
jgi:RHS repeat-associated protein